MDWSSFPLVSASNSNNGAYAFKCLWLERQRAAEGLWDIQEYKGEKIGQAKPMETLGIAASFAPTNPVQPSPRLLHNGHTITKHCIR